MNVLDLFSGIGGFSLGLERAGMKTVAFCEIEPFCRRVLAKHWPEVPCYDDVRTLTAERLAADGIAVDVICGGFPCQDISLAGKGAGIEGERSGLWAEYARLIGELRPKYVIVENVSALLSRGLDRVLGDLAALGYDAEWHCIPASAVGAPHRRDRIWIIAYPGSEQHEGSCVAVGRQAAAGFSAAHMADADSFPWHEGRSGDGAQEQRRWNADRGGIRPDVCDPNGSGLEIWQRECGDARAKQPSAFRTNWWAVEPDVGRVAHGIPARVGRLRSLGNAVVPQIPEIIGRAIMEAHGSQTSTQQQRGSDDAG